MIPHVLLCPFVELPSRPSGEYVIEIEGQHAATVRLRVSGMPLSDLATLGRLLAGAA